MPSRRLIFSAYAIRRMFDRGIGVAEVRSALSQGRVIEEYPEDAPYPSRLSLGWWGRRPIHVLAADVPGAEDIIVITAYQPNESEWEPGFAKRRV
jgi:hypothetical protein